MRIALVSGVAGQAERFESVLAAVDAGGADQLVVFGDLVGAGLGSARVIELLASRQKTTALAGPMDRWVLGRQEDRSGGRFEAGHRHARRELSLAALAWLDERHEQLVLELEGWSLELGLWPEAESTRDARLDLPLPPGPGRIAISPGPRAGWSSTKEGLRLLVPPLSSHQDPDPRASLTWLELPEAGAPIVHVARVAFPARRLAARLDKLARRGTIDRRTLTVVGRDALGRLPKDSARPQPTEGAESAMPLLVDLARQVYRPLSGRWPDDDVPVVHQVRVATRRLQEGLQLFRGRGLDEERLSKAVSRLRALRRRLAPRRAIDVQLLCLDEQIRHAEVGAAERLALVSALEEMRARATAKLADGGDRLKYARHGLDVLDLAMSVAAEPWARFLPAQLERRREECRGLLHALDTEQDAPAHHELRKAMKRLRYACELAAFAVGPGSADALLTGFRPLQDAFGRYNDMYEMRVLMDRAEVVRLLEPVARSRLIDHFQAARHAGFREAQATLEASFPALLREVGRLGASLPLHAI